MTLPKIVELVTKKEIPALQRYLIFEVRQKRQQRLLIFHRQNAITATVFFCEMGCCCCCCLHIICHPGLSTQYLLLSQPLRTTETNT